MKKKASNAQIAWQIIAAALSIGIVLMSLESFLHFETVWAAGVGSLASSIYLVYIQPSSPASHPKNMAFCYVIAFVVGLLLHALLSWVSGSIGVEWSPAAVGHVADLIGAVALAATMLLSVKYVVPHPPAAGMALVLALDMGSLFLCLVLFGGVLFVCICRYILRNKLVDLW